MFKKVYELSLQKNYVSHWGMAEAVREFIQNAIDSESPFCYEFVAQDGNLFKLVLKSEFTVLQASSLLLGSSSKIESKNSIGSFGEGYKIAMLVLTRLGYKVVLKNGNVSWIPRFEFNRQFKEEILVVEEDSLSEKNKGLVVEIYNLDKEDISKIRECCLLMQDEIGEIKSTSYGDILLQRKGLLYVGGLFICETELEYSYNLKPEHIKLERDRQTVSSFDLQFLTKEIWFETQEYEKVAEMIESGIKDVEYAEYHSPEIVKEACYKLFKSRHPNSFVAKSQEELESMVEKGMEKIVVVGRAFYKNVAESESYKKEKPILVESVKSQLESWLKKNRSYMRKEAIVSFKNIIELSTSWINK